MIENIQEINNNINKAGYINVVKIGSVISIGGVEYTYHADGCCKVVYLSPCGKWVLKTPKNSFEYHKEHLVHEVNAYNEAPKWCKLNIAETHLLENGWTIQERLEIIEFGSWFRELGIRHNTDGSKTYVVFDCDVFLDFVKKPEDGYLYQRVFSKTNIFGDAYTYACNLPKRLEQLQKRVIIDFCGSMEIFNNGCTSINNLYYFNGELLPERMQKILNARCECY